MRAGVRVRASASARFTGASSACNAADSAAAAVAAVAAATHIPSSPSPPRAGPLDCIDHRWREGARRKRLVTRAHRIATSMASHVRVEIAPAPARYLPTYVRTYVRTSCTLPPVHDYECWKLKPPLDPRETVCWPARVRRFATALSNSPTSARTLSA